MHRLSRSAQLRHRQLSEVFIKPLRHRGVSLLRGTLLRHRHTIHSMVERSFPKKKRRVAHEQQRVPEIVLQVWNRRNASKAMAGSQLTQRPQPRLRSV